MPGQLTYRGTFIHFDEEEQELDHANLRSRRSRSLPPGGQESWECDWKEKDVALKRYVGNLLALPASDVPKETQPSLAPEDPPEKVDEPDSSLTEESHPDPEPENAADDFAQPPSQGSLGHPGICRRPCVHFAKAISYHDAIIIVISCNSSAKCD